MPSEGIRVRLIRLIGEKFLGRVIRLHRPGLNHGARVTFLPVLALGRHRPRHIAARQSERRSERRQRRNEYRYDDLDDLFLAHNS